jgi:peroxiredoxin
LYDDPKRVNLIHRDMKKLLLVLFLSPLIAIAQVKTQGFTLEGKFEGFADGTDVLLYKNGDNTEMARTKLMKEKFTIKGSLPEPVLCFLVVGNEKPVEVFLENASVTVKSKKTQPPVYEVEGSASHKEFTAFVDAFMPYAKQLSSLASTINTTMPGDERDKLSAMYKTTQDDIQKQIEKFIRNNPKSYVSPFILSATYSFKEDVMALENRYKMLDDKIKKSEAGIQLQAFIAESKIGAIGTDAMDFSQPDTTGKPISLSSFRGKYVLVDFWASWCRPCRMENPNVVENYKKFSKKNFTVLGVSLDREGQKDAWVNAIHEDKLTWTHVSDLQFWNNAAAQLYKVKGIPQNFLIDPQGKIIAKNQRGADLEAKLCEVLGCDKSETKTNSPKP